MRIVLSQKKLGKLLSLTTRCLNVNNYEIELWVKKEFWISFRKYFISKHRLSIIRCIDDRRDVNIVYWSRTFGSEKVRIGYFFTSPSPQQIGVESTYFGSIYLNPKIKSCFLEDKLLKSLKGAGFRYSLSQSFEKSQVQVLEFVNK